MSSEPAAVDAAKFFEVAVREKLLTSRTAKELRREARQRPDATPAQVCIDAGRLTPIQAEAIEGLAAPESIAPGYEVVGLLGYGGIGVVYRARQPALDRFIALKTISAERLGATTAPARFQQEARAIAKLKHPNIVTAYDYGSTAGRFYFAMEMVDGVDLDTHIKRSGTITEQVVWQVVHQVASALAHAHEAGIVHRDIKPANLLLTDPPAGYPLPAGASLVKVTDFGLVQLRAAKPAEESTRLTVSGATMGTPNYMAPEQIDDAHVDHRADIYALGATAFHMLTGRPPYAGQSLMKVITAKLTGDSEPLDSLPEGITRPTRELLSAMMAHEPGDRPQQYQQLLERVGGVLQEGGLDSRVVPLAPRILTEMSNTPSQQDAETIVSLERLINERRTRRRWLLGGAAAVAALATGGLLWSRPRRLPAPRLGGRLHERGLLNTKELKFPEWRSRDGFFGVVPASGAIGPDGVQRYPNFASGLWFQGGVDRQLLGSEAWKGLVGDWYEDRDPAAPAEPFRHFGVEFRLALGAADSVEVLPFWQQGEAADGKPRADAVLRIATEGIRLGARPADGAGVTSAYADFSKPIAPDEEVELRLERDATHWFAYWQRDDTPIAATPIGEAGLPSGLLFQTPPGAPAVLLEVYLYALEPRPPVG